MDAVRAPAQAQHGMVRIEVGTKGGLARDVPITNPLEQKFLLANAANIQENARSLIPAHQTYREFRAEAYAELRSAGIRSHGERHAYAQERYAALVGAPAPVAAGLPRQQHHRFWQFDSGSPWRRRGRSISRPAGGSPPSQATAASMSPTPTWGNDHEQHGNVDQSPGRCLPASRWQNQPKSYCQQADCRFRGHSSA